MQSTPNGPKPIVSVKESKKFCKDTCVLYDDGVKWCKDTSNEWAKCVIGCSLLKFFRNANALPVKCIPGQMEASFLSIFPKVKISGCVTIISATASHLQYIKK